MQAAFAYRSPWGVVATATNSTQVFPRRLCRKNSEPVLQRGSKSFRRFATAEPYYPPGQSGEGSTWQRTEVL